MRELLLAGMLLVSAMAAAQEAAPPQEPSKPQAIPSSPSLREELAHLAVEAESLHKELPNFTCKETAVSQAIQKKKVKREVRFSADLRVQRGNDGSDETVHMTELNGKPYTGAEPSTPIMVRGGFDQVLDYFRLSAQPCYVYTLRAGRVDFESTTRSSDDVLCGERGAVQGFALLNSDGDVIHMERRVAEADAFRYGLVPFAAVDLAPVELSGKTYQLSSKMVAEIPRADWLGHFEATYTSCRLFKATITIRPGSNVVTDEPEKP